MKSGELLLSAIELMDESLKLPERFLRLSVEIRQSIAAENEYWFSAMALYVYLGLATKIISVPPEMGQLADFYNNLPSDPFILGTALAGIGVIDGSFRIAHERLPFYKEYVRFTFLGKK